MSKKKKKAEDSPRANQIAKLFFSMPRLSQEKVTSHYTSKGQSINPQATVTRTKSRTRTRTRTSTRTRANTVGFPHLVIRLSHKFHSFLFSCSTCKQSPLQKIKIKIRIRIKLGPILEPLN